MNLTAAPLPGEDIDGTWTASVNAGITQAYAVYARRTSDSAGAVNNTLADDTVLVVPVVASALYRVDAFIKFTAAGAAASNGFKAGWSGPSGATFDWVWSGKIDTDGTASASTIWQAANTISSTQNSGGAGATALVARPYGYLLTSTTAGNLTFRWAQATTDAGNATVVKSGSVLEVRRID